MTIHTRLRSCAALPGVITALLAFPAIADESGEIDEIIVTADLLGRSADELPASLTLLDAGQIDALSLQHFEELVNVVPNLNWSGDGHRARYFQIRGVGELEQYQGAPNPSVGFLVDDIDFSGIGTVATLFDIERIEVLRGPQGSRYGANALAGLVYMQSATPSAERNGLVHFSAGEDDLRSVGIAFSGALTNDEHALFRVSAEQHRGNGFRRNEFLGRKDTNGRDELTLRGRLLLEPTDNVEINIAAMFADIDNGYDAFALDNSYTVQSDKPGRDAQQSTGASVRVDWFVDDHRTATSITAYADSDIDFDFDADWGSGDSWSPFIYDYTSTSDRSRRTLSQELRLASSDNEKVDWLAGIYALRLDDGLRTANVGEYFDPFFNFADSLDDSFASDYRADTLAAFGQVERALGADTRLAFGLRLERREAEYSDSAGLRASPAETMIGGEITLSHDLDGGSTLYASLARGLKAGGFNLGAVPDERREFAAEALWNLELGLRGAFAGDSLRYGAAVFSHRREDQQVRTSLQLIPGDPASFIFFTDNAATGNAVGFEADIEWLIAEHWQAYAHVGLLDATFDDYQGVQGDLGGRRQAHAPGYTFALGAEWRADNGWYTRVDINGKDDFYFDVSHDQQSDAYELVNVRVGFDAERWSVNVWVRNLFDTDYAVRGFYFGNEPPDFPNTLYTRLGDPRQLGMTLNARF